MSSPGQPRQPPYPPGPPSHQAASDPGHGSAPPGQYPPGWYAPPPKPPLRDNRRRIPVGTIVAAGIVVLVAAVLVEVGALLFVLRPVGQGRESHTGLRTIATFQGTGTRDTAPFRTGGPWFLVWACGPEVRDAPAPFGFTISVKTQDDYLFGTKVLDTLCVPGSTDGTVAVHQTGEQWLTVETGRVGGTWSFTVEVAADDTNAGLLPTPLPTAAP